MFDIEYGSIEDRVDGDFIRLLTLIPSEDATDPIHVRLAEVKLTNEPTYEALSYCWGDASSKVIVFCDGKPFAVTDNLESALRHLRSKDEERVLWVDAICINQKNLSERSHQVNLMADIYKTATKVIVWLGDADDDSDLVFPLCERMTEARRYLLDSESSEFSSRNFLWGPNKNQIVRQRLAELKRQRAEAQAKEQESREDLNNENEHDGAHAEGLEADSNSQAEDADANSEGPEEVADATKKESVAFLRLLGRPWFTRCWVLQEVALGREVEVICGTQSIDWNVFYVGFALAVLYGENALVGRPTQILTGGLILMMLLRIRTQQPENTTTLWDFLWLLQKVLPLEATDPRDKVYSILGLMSEDESLPSGLKPDYTISVEECYKRTAIAIMSHTHNLDILITGRRPKNEFKLPSWVTNWSSLERPAPVTLVREDSVLTPEVQDSDEDDTKREPNFCASKGVTWTPIFRNDANTLVLSGFVFDQIVQIEDILTVPSVDQVDIQTNRSSMKATTSFWKRLYTDLGKYFDTLVRWEKLALSKKYPKYPTGEDPELVFATTMCLGLIPDGPELGLQRFKRWRETLKGPKKLNFLTSIGVDGSLYKSVVAIAGVVSGRKNLKDRVFATATERTLYRRLARTAKGYLAIVPSQTVVGDHITLFQGGKTPFVIRHTANRAQSEFIGPSYVHGIMQGEGWDVGLCKEMEIV